MIRSAAAAQDDFLGGLPMRAGMASGKAHQRRRIELLDEQLDGALVEVRRLARELENTEHSQEVLEEVCEICTALRTPATRAQRAELALRWFESDITWYGR